jgi:hypothetical protein
MLEPIASMCSLIRPSALLMVLARAWMFGGVGFSFFRAVMASSMICRVGLLSNWFLAAMVGGGKSLKDS